MKKEIMLYKVFFRGKGRDYVSLKLVSKNKKVNRNFS